MIRFLREEASRGQSLFLVGDLFDFWFEWRYSIPSGAFPVLASLHDLVRSGVRVVYLGGNHDGHVGKFLEREVGLKTFRDPIDVFIDGHRFHLVHGDGIARRDYSYRMLRRLVRWGPTEAIYRLVHPDLGIWFANRVSHFSRHQISSRTIHPADSYHEYASRMIEKGTEFVVMGHRHESERIEINGGVLLAVGDWIGKGSYGLFEGGEGKLLEFPT